MKIIQTLKNRTKSHHILYMLLISGLFLTFSHPALATNSSTVDYQVNIAPSLNISVTSGGSPTSNVRLDLNPNNKTFDHKAVDINVATNNATGYRLFVTTANNSTELARDNTDEAFSSSTIPTIPTLTPTTPTTTGYSESDFKNCVVADCTNKWGYKVIASDINPSIVTTNYFPFTLNHNLATNHYATNGDNTSLEFAAKIDYNIPAGTYENTLVFTATATYAAYSINYYDGVDNTAGNEIATQENDYNTSSNITLSPVYTGGATGPTRSGLSGDTYTFVKWCDQIPTGETQEGYFAATVCPGNSYPANGTITIDPTQSSTNLNLYAYWDPTTFEEAYQAAGKSTYGSSGLYQMQDMTSGTGGICAAVTVGEKAQLKDTRGTSSTYYYNYWVAKLKDDKCWMVQNLRLGNELATTSGTLPLTSANSDVTSAFTLTNKLPSPGAMPRYAITDDKYNSDGGGSTNTYISGIPSTSAFYCTPAPLDPIPNYYVGCYYNWYTTIAGGADEQITPGTATGAPSYIDVDTSICPKGWKLPTGGRGNGDFQILYNNYHSSTMMLNAGTCISSGQTNCDNANGANTPSYFLSGVYYSSGANSGSINTNGQYWSRSAYSKGLGHLLYLTNSLVNAWRSDNKNSGMSVRCLAYGS